MYQKTEKEIMKSWKGDINTPVVSVCCTTYNHEPYIAEAIEGFLMQETDFPFEILIRDDCSTDKTTDIIREYTKKYPTLIKPIFEQENTRSKGIRPMPQLYKIAKGEYIALCDGDDYWSDKHKLQIQISEMNRYDIGMCFHANSKLYSSGLIEKEKLKQAKKIFSISEIITGDFHLVQTNTMVFKKEYLKNLNLNVMDSSPVGDVWTRIAVSIPDGALYINKNMAVYRVQSDGSWSSSMKKDKTKFLKFVNKMIESIDNFDKEWEYKYRNEFKYYKNRYFNIVIKQEGLDVETKNQFVITHLSSMSIQNKLFWFGLYRYDKVVKFLKKIKRGVYDKIYNK